MDLTWLSHLLPLIALVGCLYGLTAAVLAGRFARKPAPALGAAAPSVTILKPLCGIEPNLYENLETVCQQAYAGSVQVVFGVQNAADPAIAVVRRLQAAYPGKRLDLVIDARQHGTNRKVSNLINMSGLIAHEVIVLADSDMVVKPDYLGRLVAELGQPGVNGVTCLYHGVPAHRGIWAHLSALAIDVQFLPNVVMGTSLGLANPCFGSTIAFTAEALAEIGGFEAFRNDLADDYAVGEALRAKGGVGRDSELHHRPYLRRHGPRESVESRVALEPDHPQRRPGRLRRLPGHPCLSARPHRRADPRRRRYGPRGGGLRARLPHHPLHPPGACLRSRSASLLAVADSRHPLLHELHLELRLGCRDMEGP